MNWSFIFPPLQNLTKKSQMSLTNLSQLERIIWCLVHCANLTLVKFKSEVKQLEGHLIQKMMIDHYPLLWFIRLFFWIPLIRKLFMEISSQESWFSQLIQYGPLFFINPFCELWVLRLDFTILNLKKFGALIIKAFYLPLVPFQK